VWSCRRHRVATGKEGPRCQDCGDNRDSKSDLEDHRARHRDLRRGAETHEDAREAQDDPRLAVETLGVRVHRLAFGNNLREHDRQRRQLLILVYFDKATSRV